MKTRQKPNNKYAKRREARKAGGGAGRAGGRGVTWVGSVLCGSAQPLNNGSRKYSRGVQILGAIEYSLRALIPVASSGLIQSLDACAGRILLATQNIS